MRLQTFLFTLALVVLISGCSTSGEKEFRKVKRGMKKAVVLDKVGSPVQKDRDNGLDIWTYRFFNEDGLPTDRIVVFKEGYATYVGAPLTATHATKGSPAETHKVPAEKSNEPSKTNNKTEKADDGDELSVD